jgi:hypothetical protein
MPRALPSLATSAALALLASCAAVPRPTAPQTPPALRAAEPERIDWALLGGFVWEPPDPEEERADPPLPEAVRALDGREVEIEAELAPVAWGEQAAIGYVLTRLPNACCVCVLPPFAEWIELEGLDEESAERRSFGRVRLRGRLSVGPRRDEWGYVRSLYRLSGARFADRAPSGS